MNTDISTFRNEVSSHVQKAQKFSIEESGERTSKFKPQEQTVKKKEIPSSHYPSLEILHITLFKIQ